MSILGNFNYVIAITLSMIGFYVLIERGNLIKKLVGLNVFQTSVFLLYISMGKIEGGTPPTQLREWQHQLRLRLESIHAAMG